MYFRESSYISPFSSIYLRQKESFPLLGPSEALSNKTEKKTILFNFVYDGFCHKIITTIQKIFLSCFGDIGFPTAAIV